MTNSTSIPELRNTWESAAPGWAKWEAKLSAGLADATEALIDMAEVAPGMRVLDLACGMLRTLSEQDLCEVQVAKRLTNAQFRDSQQKPGRKQC